MGLIVNENYYQKKVWKQARIEQEVREEFAQMTPDELEEREQRWDRSLDKAVQSFEEKQITACYQPDIWRRWKFKRVIKKALAVAEYFELDILIEANDNEGSVKMRGDQILSDEATWHDSKQKRQLFQLVQWAEYVWIDIAEEDHVSLLDISLTYKLVRQFRKRKRK